MRSGPMLGSDARLPACVAKRLRANLVVVPVAKDLVLLRQARDRIDREFAQPLDVAAIAGTARPGLRPARLRRA